MIQNSCDALDDFGIPEFIDGKQQKIEFDIEDEDWSIKGLGYLDLVFPNGHIVDLKTTHSCPSVMSPEHQLQRAFYKTARSNYQVSFLYVTKAKAQFLEDGDEVSIMNDAKLLIKQMDNFCNMLTPEAAGQSYRLHMEITVGQAKTILETFIITRSNIPMTRKKQNSLDRHKRRNHVRAVKNNLISINDPKYVSVSAISGADYIYNKFNNHNKGDNK